MTNQTSLKDARVKLLKAGGIIKQKIACSDSGLRPMIDKHHDDLSQLMDVSMRFVKFIDEVDYTLPVNTFLVVLCDAVNAYCHAVKQFNDSASSLNLEMFACIDDIGTDDYVAYKLIENGPIYSCIQSMNNAIERLVDKAGEFRAEYDKDVCKEYAKEFNKFI